MQAQAFYAEMDSSVVYKRSKKLITQSAEAVGTESTAKEFVDQLNELLPYHEWRYYVKDDPILSDFEYDQLYKFLERLENQFPELVLPDSPTQRVSNDLTEKFDSVAHLTPMLSLANSYNAEDLHEFDKQVRKLCMLDESEPIEYSVEPKFDGGSLAIVYEEDRMTRAATRGNGVKGEEITPNIRTLYSVPLKAAFSSKEIQTAELRGEALIRLDNFEKINQKRQEAGKSLFANPRNAATGALRMKDPKETAERGLEVFLYQLGYARDKAGNDVMSQFTKHSEQVELLADLGFKVPTVESKVCQNIQEVADFCAEWEGKRAAYAYEIDGMVVKVNRLDYQEKCGYTSHHPRWAIAYKFKAKQATSKLLSVEFQVGKVGSITPVAKLEPVSVAGVTISSVSLHNEEFIQSKDIRIGDTVVVERAGDVIPYIVKVLDDVRTGEEQPVVFPTHCPVCGTKLVKGEGEAAWRCPNYYCDARVVQRMIHHVSKDAMDIDGFGESYVRRFREEGWLKTLADIYRLDYDQIAQLEGFGKRSAANLREAIEKAKQKPLRRFLYGLSVHHLGKKASKILAGHVEHALDLRHWTVEQLTDIKDIGPVLAQNVVDFFAKEQNIALLNELESLGVNLSQTEEDRPQVVAADAPLLGKTILFTGTLETMTRKQAQQKAEAAGAKNISAVSGNLNILVAGAKAGSKLKKAQALGTVQILSELEFVELIND